MFLHLVVLLSLSWPHVIGTADLQDQIFDQVATASENVAQSAKKLEQKEFRDQLIPSMIDTTIHYENFNGFVPMTASSTPKQPDTLSEITSSTKNTNITWTNSLKQSDNSSTTCIDDKKEDNEDNADDDPAYSTESRIFLNFPNFNNNRRSFEYQSGQNEFELLKVRNDTPMVANYPDFYEDSSSSTETKDDEVESSSRQRNKGQGQKVEHYAGNYGMVLNENKDDRSTYEDYYSRNTAKDKEKKSQVKANVNYRQQDSLNYDGHGQTATRQNGQTTFFSRTNQQSNTPTNNNAKNHNYMYDSVAATSQISKTHQKFSRPVVVAESSYNFDHQSSRKSNSGVDDYETARIIDSASDEVSHRHTIHNRDSRFRSEEDSRDSSDDGDYLEYTERPRRVQKGRRRPSNADNSKRLQKEHRGTIDESGEFENQGKRHHSSRTKSHRQRVRGNSWFDDNRHQDQDDSYEDSRYDGRASSSETRYKNQHSSKFKPSNTWNQVSPNLEISHSNGVEIGQLEKPKLIVPVKVNLVPVANFDHATAIGSSQGFDMSNAVLQNIVSGNPLNAVSTPSSVMSSTESVLGQDSKIRVSTPVPDIIVGQNSYQNSIQTILPQSNEQNKFSVNFKPQFMSTTVAPVLAVTPSLQSISVQDIQGASTPRSTYVSNQVQQASSNQVQVPQLVVPQPTVQTISTLLHNPVPNTDFNIQVNPHGMHGQNLIDHGNLQVQAVPTMSTVTSTAQSIPVTKFSLLPAESQSKKTLIPNSNTNFLTSVNFAAGQNDQRQLNGNYYLQNSNGQQVKSQVQGNLYQQVLRNVNVNPKTKTYVQTAQLLPALFHQMPTIATISASTPQVLSDHQNVQGANVLLQAPRIQNSGSDNQFTTLRKLPSLMYQTIDSTGSHSTSNVNTVNGFSGITDTAHLPYVGTRNVEILNPNIKPSPIDSTVVNSYETMHYPATVLTTSIPMFTTTSFVTARPALLSSTTTESSHVQNLVNSLTEIGSKNNHQSTGDLKAYQTQDRPVFNPINFVPNMDLMKSQNALNSKLHATEPLPQNLNLVPLIPGGNFFKPSFSAQSELLVKPKLNSDLATYAEQMFKESLKTIYNTQKWNNDRKQGNQARQNVSDSMDIAKLQSELQRLKASLYDSKRNKDQLEGHQSETKVQTAELPGKKSNEFLAALEQMFKNHHKEPTHVHYGNNKPYRYRRPDQDKYNVGSKGERFKDTKHIKDFMTPPHSSPYRSKGHFYDKPGKKRPISGPPRHNHHNHHHHHHGPTPYTRHHFSHKTGGVESSATNHDPVYLDGFSHRGNSHNSRQRIRSEFRKGSPSDSYSSFSAPLPEKNGQFKGFNQHKGFVGKESALNHPKMHNLLGLMMKNKQLPEGSSTSYFQDKDQLQQFFEGEKQRLQKQFYDDTLRDYFYKMSDGPLSSNSGSDTRRSLPHLQKRNV